MYERTIRSYSRSGVLCVWVSHGVGFSSRPPEAVKAMISLIVDPEYGLDPSVSISHNRTPKLHTSELDE